jgi:hypothetical protein
MTAGWWGGAAATVCFSLLPDGGVRTKGIGKRQSRPEGVIVVEGGAGGARRGARLLDTRVLYGCITMSHLNPRIHEQLSMLGKVFDTISYKLNILLLDLKH